MDEKERKYKFSQKSLEYLDHQKLPKKDKAYYSKFIDEYYGNSLSKDISKIKTQLHNTSELVDKVYAQTNSKHRDLLSHVKATNHLSEKIEVEECADSLYEEDRYYHMLKTNGYNDTLKELFEDYATNLSHTNTSEASLKLLKLFYIDFQKLNREERSWKRKEKKIAKRGNDETK